MLFCPRTGCGMKKVGGSNYQPGDICPNGHKLTSDDLNESRFKDKKTTTEPVFRTNCRHCGRPNDDDQKFKKDELCPTCHQPQ